MRIPACHRGHDRANQSRGDMEFRRNHVARSRTDCRRAVVIAHTGCRADASDERSRSPRAGRTPRSASPRGSRWRPVLRVARGRARCGSGSAAGRRPPARRGRRRDRRAEPPLRARPAAAAASCCYIAAACSMRARTNGWAGNASAASCTNSTACCAARRIRPLCRSPAVRRRCRPTCATSSPSTPIRVCHATPRCG